MKQSAIAIAVSHGAEESSCTVVEVEDFQMPYSDGLKLRVRVRVVGDLLLGVKTLTSSDKVNQDAGAIFDQVKSKLLKDEVGDNGSPSPAGVSIQASITDHKIAYKTEHTALVRDVPEGVLGEAWRVTLQDVQDIGTGAGILGTGGGGSPYGVHNETCLCEDISLFSNIFLCMSIQPLFLRLPECAKTGSSTLPSFPFHHYPKTPTCYAWRSWEARLCYRKSFREDRRSLTLSKRSRKSARRARRRWGVCCAWRLVA